MLVYLIPIVIFGIISTYTDMKERLIKNKLIIVMLVTSIIIHTSQLLFFPELQQFIPNFLINIVYAVIIGILLWTINIWPAGDAKLFIAYSSLIPLSFFSVGMHFLSFEFMINTFVPVFFVMFIFLIVKSKRKEIIKSVKFALDPYKLFMIIIILTGFMWFIVKAVAFTGIFMNYFIIIILLFVIIEVLNKIIPINMEYVYIALLVIRFIIDYRTVLTLGYAYELATIIFAYIIIRYFVIDLGFQGFTKTVKIKDLKPEMCLAEGICKTGNKEAEYEKKRIMFLSTIQAMSERGKAKFIHETSFDGLTRKDVGKIKKLRKDGKILFDEIMIHTTTPFAFFLFIGILLTILLQTNFITYIKTII